MSKEPKFSVALNVPEAIAKEFFAKIDLKKCDATAPKPAQASLWEESPQESSWKKYSVQPIIAEVPVPVMTTTAAVSHLQQAIFGFTKKKANPDNKSTKILKELLNYCMVSITDLQRHYKWCDINKERNLAKDIGKLVSEFDSLRDLINKKLEKQTPVSEDFVNDMLQCFRHLDESFLAIDDQIGGLQGEGW